MKTRSLACLTLSFLAVTVEKAVAQDAGSVEANRMFLSSPVGVKPRTVGDMLKHNQYIDQSGGKASTANPTPVVAPAKASVHVSKEPTKAAQTSPKKSRPPLNDASPLGAGVGVGAGVGNGIGIGMDKPIKPSASMSPLRLSAVYGLGDQLRALFLLNGNQIDLAKGEYHDKLSVVSISPQQVNVIYQQKPLRFDLPSDN